MLLGHFGGDAILFKRQCQALLLQMQPVLVKTQPVPLPPQSTKGVEIAVTLAAPMAELDAEFKGCTGSADKLGFINATQLIVFFDCRNGCFTDADSADLLGFYQPDLKLPAGQL